MKKIIFALMFVLVPFMCQAELRIDIAGAQSNPIPVAVTEFSGDDLGRKISHIIEQDLERSGLFRIMNKEAFLQKFPSINTQPRFSDWQAIKAQALLQGQVDRLPGDKLKVSFRLWDVFAGQALEGKALTFPAQDYRRLAHMVADMVYSRVTGETGYFDTQVVYVSQSGQLPKRTYRLAIMDQDGANQRYLTDGSVMVLTPRFSPNMQKITYMSYKGGRPRVYIMDLKTGEDALIGTFSGMTFAPRFSPDSKQLIMSWAQDGNSEIYLYNIADQTQKRLTNHPAIDTSPSFSPDAKKIVFNSDRGGSQQLYVMDADGSNVKRISFGQGASYATPVWSPRGDYIAFTKIQDGEFYIGVMRTDGSQERLIAKGFLVEGPTWAPNGRVIMFYREMPMDANGGSGLYTIDITGYNERFIPTPFLGTAPAWSPLLH